MNTSEIRAIAEIMRETGLTSLEYSENGVVVRMSRGSAGAAAVSSHAEGGGLHDGAADNCFFPDDTYTVASPMVGVFYAAPDEDQEPFVNAGDKVSPGDVLCIIEAMKMMNEITAEKGGVISEVCAQNKQVVEFGSPLFRISPAAQDMPQ